MAILIKRYANRKLYDTVAKRYVTLDDLEAMIRAGKEIAVRDVATGQDLTPVILTQIMLVRERGGVVALPNAFLHQLIRHGGAWQDFMARGLAATLEGVVSSQREANRIFREWSARAGLAGDDAAPKRPRKKARVKKGGPRKPLRT
jgi:polyhydroxyalkanoate synthesis repressor PhaR